MFLYRDPPALHQVLAASVHLLATREKMSMFVNVNVLVGSHVHTDMTVIQKQESHHRSTFFQFTAHYQMFDLYAFHLHT